MKYEIGLINIGFSRKIGSRHLGLFSSGFIPIIPVKSAAFFRERFELIYALPFTIFKRNIFYVSEIKKNILAASFDQLLNIFIYLTHCSRNMNAIFSGSIEPRQVPDYLDHDFRSIGSFRPDKEKGTGTDRMHVIDPPLTSNIQVAKGYTESRQVPYSFDHDFRNIERFMHGQDKGTDMHQVPVTDSTGSMHVAKGYIESRQVPYSFDHDFRAIKSFRPDQNNGTHTYQMPVIDLPSTGSIQRTAYPPGMNDLSKTYHVTMEHAERHREIIKEISIEKAGDPGHHGAALQPTGYDINRIASHVFSLMEQKIRVEKERRGIFG